MYMVCLVALAEWSAPTIWPEATLRRRVYTTHAQLYGLCLHVYIACDDG